jgi:DNA-binding LacI/PurR family transcriptional regulator
MRYLCATKSSLKTEKAMTTIKDVAKKAGVSVSTVSYALSGSRPISETTRKRIKSAVEELNYHPNLLARGLINKRTRIIALLYPTLALSELEDLPTEFIASVTNVTYERDYGLLLFTHELGESEIQRLMNQGLVDGLVLMEVLRHDPRVELMKKFGYPFTLIGHGANNDGISYVDMDFYTAYHLAVEHLAELNHQEIGFLPTILDIENPKHNYLFESIRGFREASQKYGIHGTSSRQRSNRSRWI